MKQVELDYVATKMMKTTSRIIFYENAFVTPPEIYFVRSDLIRIYFLG